MAERPSKRQKRLVVHSSDDEDDPSQSQTASIGTAPAQVAADADAEEKLKPVLELPSRTRARAKAKARPTQSTASASSPKKTRPGKRPIGPKNSIFSFFNASTERQRQREPEPVQQQEFATTQEEDAIFDDLLHESFDHGPRKDAAGKVKPSSCRLGSQSTSNSRAPAASRKFLKTSSAGRPSSSEEKKTSTLETDEQPWASKYAPQDLSELAVHRKKVSDVQDWLERVLGGRAPWRVLILKGASGTGKTATVSLLAKALGLDVLEWRNPVGSEDTSEGFTSMSAQFEDFLGRGRTFGGLDLAGSDGKLSNETKDSGRRKIILVEEFPNTFTRSSTAIQSFRSTILQYLAANAPSARGLASHSQIPSTIVPLIINISETLLTTESAVADSFTAHRLLGPEISHHPGVSMIEFNPIARTLMTKALQLVLRKEAGDSGRRTVPGVQVLEQLGQIGDIRSAVGALEFACLRAGAEQGANWGGNVAPKKGKRGATEKLTEKEQETLEMVTHREATLGIFHAVGKVVYNKRDETSSSDTLAQPPAHLALHARPKPSQVQVNDLIDETGTDTSTFISALHENYILSCAGESPNTSLDMVDGCIEALSEGDILSGGGGRRYDPQRGSGGAQTLRQDEISFHVSVRGLLFSLPSPVKRCAPPPPPPPLGRAPGASTPVSRGDAHKMFYPKSLKLWRRIEEMGSLVDAWVLRCIRGEVLLPSSLDSGVGVGTGTKGTVESWGQRAPPSSSSSSSSSSGASPTSLDTPTPTTTIPQRQELILHVLPYLARITSQRTPSANVGPSHVRDLAALTTFEGASLPSNEDFSDGDDEPISGQGRTANNAMVSTTERHWATDGDADGEGDGEGRNRRARRGADKHPPGPGRGGNELSGVNFDNGMLAERDRLKKGESERLVLSDDDIED